MTLGYFEAYSRWRCEVGRGTYSYQEWPHPWGPGGGPPCGIGWRPWWGVL